MPIKKEWKAETSPELNQIIYAVPSWILKRGITIIMMILILIVFISHQVKYPNLFKTTMTITSEQGNAQKFYGIVKIPQQNIHQIRIGQRTIIKLKSYPYQQYGIIEGKVDALPNQVLDTLFTAKILIPVLKKDSRNKPIQLKKGMVADVEIVINENSLLQKIIKKW
jgi:hypothetical protein